MSSQEDSFISHLVELRSRLLRMLMGFLLAFVCLFPFSNQLYTLLAKPLLAQLPAGGKLIATAVTTPFFVPMKVAMLAALVLSLPYMLHQIWSFIAPGLYAHEKRLVLPLVISSTLLFLAGMAFAYFVVFPVVFGFIVGVAPQGVMVMTDIENYLDFTITMFLAFGVAFEVPVLVVILVHLGMVDVAQLRQARAYVIVGAFVIGAIFTPPDVVSQVMLAVPLWLLYEAGIVAAQLLHKAHRD
ncbi:MAG: twin-arginine translocase subunit TatC [Methylophilaceae bacterium]|nr:twin-arginine translocase subunit TatC [Methylophilaceae bacterium]